LNINLLFKELKGYDIIITFKRIVDLEIERQQNLMESLEIEDNIDDILL